MKNVQFEVGKKYGQCLCTENDVNAKVDENEHWWVKQFNEMTFTVKKRTPCRVTVIDKNGWEENLKVFKMLWVKDTNYGCVQEMEEERWKKDFWKDRYEILGQYEYLRHQEYRKKKFRYMQEMIKANRTYIDQK